MKRLALAFLLLFMFAAPASAATLAYDEDCLGADNTPLVNVTPGVNKNGNPYLDHVSVTVKVNAADEAFTQGAGGATLGRERDSRLDLGTLGFPITYDFVCSTGASNRYVAFHFRRNNSVGSYDANDLDDYYVYLFVGFSGSAAIRLYRYDDDSATQIASVALFPVYSTTYVNVIVVDTGSNIKVYCDSVAGKESLGSATTLRIDHDTTTYADNTYIGYEFDDSSGRIYRTKIYETVAENTPTWTPTDTPVVSPTPTYTPSPTHSPTPTVTRTPTPNWTATPTATSIPGDLKKFILDRERRVLK